MAGNEHDTAKGGNEDVLRQQLLRRIGIAGVLIVALIGSLALFDAVFVPETPAPVAKKAVPVQGAALAGATVDKSAVGAAAPADTSSPATAPETAPIAPTEPKAEETAKPVAPAAPAIKPITRPAVKPAASVKAVPEVAAAPTLPPVAPPPESRPEPARKLRAPMRPLSSGYLVQMGVFSNLNNAEALKSRLDKAGIPSRIEARVQVGPFRNKAEAEVARKKLAEMGLSGLLLSPRR